MGFANPPGGYTELVCDGIAIHGCPMWVLGILPSGSTSAAIKLQGDNGIVVTNPTPWGPETKKMLSLVHSGPGEPNVKYVVALNNRHHFALKSWYTQFPNAKFIGMDNLPEKKVGEDEVKFSYIIDGDAEGLGLPEELTKEFDSVYYLNGWKNDLILFHKPTKTLVAADLFLNLPYTKAFEGYYKDHPLWAIVDSAVGKLNSSLGLDGPIGERSVKFSRRHIPRDEFHGVAKMIDWPVERILVCHGGVIDGPEVPTIIDTVFGKLGRKAT